MKKIFTSLLLLTAMAVTANAEMITVWEGTQKIENWDVSVDLRDAQYLSHFNKANIGDVITVTYTTDQSQNNSQIQITNPTGNWQKYDDNAFYELSPSAGTKTFSYTIPNNEILDGIKTNGIAIQGQYITVTKVELEIKTESGEVTPPDTPEEGTTQILWNEENGKTLNANAEDENDKKVDLSYTNRGFLADVKIGDLITVTYINNENGAYAQISNPNGWQPFDGESDETATLNEASTITYTIPNVETMEIIQRDGILITGDKVTITKVELTTYPDSYEAVAITIGAEGIATYSKSFKAIDFTGTNVKAYYASAVEKGKVTLTPISQVPEYTGIIVKGEPGPYEIPVIDKIDGLGTNYLKAVGDWDGKITASTDAIYHYSFTETATPTFSLVTQDTDIPAHKAYLETTIDIRPETGSIELVFTDDTSTGINEIETEVQESGDNSYYNLQGMRVEHPTKGIYIHKGKKIIIR